MTDQTIQQKQCPRCGITRAREEFHRNKARRDGMGVYCKACSNEYGVRYSPQPTAQEIEAQTLAGEEWRPVAGYEGVYSVSNLGRVRRDLIVAGARAGRILKLSKGLYYVVTLHTHDKPKRRTVHSLVAEAFIGPRPPGMCVNHKDADKLNNRPENLEYCTPKQNTQHASRLGLMCHGERKAALQRQYGARGERHGVAKLTDAAVLAIRNEYAQGGTTHAKLAARYGVSKRTITIVVNRWGWTHI